MTIGRCESCNTIVIFNDDKECPICSNDDIHMGICPKCGWFKGRKKCTFCNTEMVCSWLSLSEAMKMSDDEEHNYVKNLIKEYFKDTYNPELAKERKSKERPAFADYVPNNVVICPYCKSNNIKKITVGSKAVHTAVFGIFSMSRNSKNYHCNNCNSDF